MWGSSCNIARISKVTEMPGDAALMPVMTETMVASAHTMLNLTRATTTLSAASQCDAIAKGNEFFFIATNTAREMCWRERQIRNLSLIVNIQSTLGNITGMHGGDGARKGDFRDFAKPSTTINDTTASHPAQLFLPTLTGTAAIFGFVVNFGRN